MEYKEKLHMKLEYLLFYLLITMRKYDFGKEIVKDLFPKRDITKQKLDITISDKWPGVLNNLKNVTYSYDWNVDDARYDYKMVESFPIITHMYKAFNEIRENNKRPLYFDLFNLASEKKPLYLFMFMDLIDNELYDPNRYSDNKEECKNKINIIRY